jgi:hypothetical protein
MFLDLDTEILFGNKTQALASIPSRDIRSKDAKANTLFANTNYEHLEANNFFNNLETLLKYPLFDPILAEKLDNLLTQASLYGGTRCRKRRRAWWSQKVTTLRCQCHLLDRLLSGYRNNIDTLSAVKQRMIDINLDFCLPESFEECKKMLKIA